MRKRKQFYKNNHGSIILCDRGEGGNMEHEHQLPASDNDVLRTIPVTMKVFIF